MKKYLLLCLLTMMLSISAANAQTFVISDIKLEGLEQVDPGRVFSNFPISIGEEIDAARVSAATRFLFRTGLFDDIQPYLNGDVLVLQLTERPSIAIINIQGNEVLTQRQLIDGLRQSGLAEGEIYKPATLDQIELDLMRLYSSQGRYSADITTQVNELPGNRVSLDININEGRIASINHINIIGNSAFNDQQLLNLFSLSLPNMWSFFTKNDQYSREKLSGDLERLRSWYLDRGYVNFSIDSTQVSLSPDSSGVFITVSITEGQQYKVGDIVLVGNLPLAEDQLRRQLSINMGDVFSRLEMVNSQQRMENILGNQGYLSAKVNPIPDVDNRSGVVDIRYFVEPGNLNYVRRINIRGNTKTADEVVRREIVQLESGVASLSDIERSKARIERTGHFQNVSVETVPVPGSSDLVDLLVTLEEASSGELQASVGYSQSAGFLVDFGISQDNFLGTGNTVSSNLTLSETVNELSFNYFNPYFTVEGVSRGFNFFVRQEKFAQDDRGDYNTDSLGLGVTFGYPIQEYQRLRLTADVEYLKIKPNSRLRTAEGDPNPNDALNVIDAFIAENDDTYLNWLLTSTWSDNQLNRGIFPTRGHTQGASFEISVPGSDLSYYRTQYNNRFYWSLNEDETWVTSFRSRLGYADSYNDTDYPFFKNYYAGGISTVRGFQSNTLGPSYSRGSVSSTPRTMGGNVLVAGSLELIFPTPLIENKNQVRTLLFFDAGNVFATECLPLENGETPAGCIDGIDLGELRFSSGLGLSWLTPIGPLSFAYAWPLNLGDEDRDQRFQFVLGRSF